ncbi:MAG: hypothetical protein ABIT37_10150 [Luteolibacter sp.]
MMLFRSLVLLGFALPLHAQVDAWDLPPVKYSDTPAQDRMAQMVKKWTQPETLPHGATPLERMREILAALEVPESSQILVFSKTSKQNGLITPANPRALYFSRDCYCGYVPGGMMEVVIQDPQLGPVFYAIDLGNPTTPPKVERDTNDCLSCHGTGRTENVPGLLLRSTYPNEDGQPLLSLGSGLITHQTPVTERWGGYYVTGSISLPHLGNRTYTDGRQAEPQQFAWKDLSGKINTSKYLRPTSDVVALMVLEHQCKAHNLLTAASMNYRRACYLGKAASPDGNPDEGAAGRVAESAAAEIVEWFLFTGEAAQGSDGVEGDGEFQRQFEAGIPHTADGKSLGEFQLNGRLFKNRCSYMIYSDAFRSLPGTVKSRVLARLWKILDSPDADDFHKEMKLPERRKIADILRETGIL